MEDYVLKITNYELRQKGYSDHLIIQIPSLLIKRGDIIFVMGSNGSGKSSIFKSLFSFELDGKNYIETNKKSSVILTSDKGFDLDLMAKEHSISQIHQAIAYQGQNDIFNSHDNVMMAVMSHAQAALLENKKTFKKHDYREKQNYILQRTQELVLKYLDDLYKYEEKYYRSEVEEKKNIAMKILKKKLAVKCSFGQQKMISILADYLKAEVMDSDMLVMDEPLNHLDAKNKKEVVSLLNEYIKVRQERKHPLTLMIISHCLVFPFIKQENCYQYQIVDKKLVMKQEKTYIDCLEKEVNKTCG